MSQYYDVILTDIQLHPQTPTKPRSLLRSILRSMRSNKPGRAYSNGGQQSAEGIQFSIPLVDKLQSEIQQALSLGKKIRILIPKAGLPIYAGHDVLEKIEALKRKGLL